MFIQPYHMKYAISHALPRSSIHSNYLYSLLFNLIDSFLNTYSPSHSVRILHCSAINNKSHVLIRFTHNSCWGNKVKGGNKSRHPNQLPISYRKLCNDLVALWFMGHATHFLGHSACKMKTAIFQVTLKPWAGWPLVNKLINFKRTTIIFHVVFPFYLLFISFTHINLW